MYRLDWKGSIRISSRLHWNHVKVKVKVRVRVGLDTSI